LGIDHPHRADESVAFPHDSLNKARFRGIVTQSGANLSNNVVDVPVGVDKQVRAPDFFDDVFARHHLLSPPHQEYQ
jgi:hypothetical protein